MVVAFSDRSARAELSAGESSYSEADVAIYCISLYDYVGVARLFIVIWESVVLRQVLFQGQVRVNRATSRCGVTRKNPDIRNTSVAYYSSSTNQPPQHYMTFVAASARKRLHSCVTLLIFISFSGSYFMALLYCALDTLSWNGRERL